MVNPANGALTLALGTTLMLTACPDDLARSRDVLFVAQRPGGTEDTYALHLADLTTRRLIKADSATSRSLPAWSPDTRSIASEARLGNSPRRLTSSWRGRIGPPMALPFSSRANPRITVRPCT